MTDTPIRIKSRALTTLPVHPRRLLHAPATLAMVGVSAIIVAVLAGLLVQRLAGSDAATIDLTTAGCGTNWSPPSSGTTIFSVRNQTASTLDVTLSGGQKVFAEIPTLGPGVTRPIRVTLEPGLYAWRCTSIGGEITFSEFKHIGGKRVPNPSPPYSPVMADDLSTAALAYRESVNAGLQMLARDTDSLEMAVKSGNKALAQRDWLTAHLDYERLGAVYDAFGNLNDEINGRPDGLVGGVNDPHFTGFLRLEYALWHDQPQATVTSLVDTLDDNVHALIKAFPSQLVQVTDIPLRAHEIMENALQFELTGDTDQGSHTNLATVQANIEGDRMTLDALRPLLATRDPEVLSEAEAQLDTLARLVDTYDSPTGLWTPVESLTLSQHQQLDADTDAALSSLDQLPAQLEQASGDTS